MLARFSGDPRLSDVPEIGVRLRWHPNLGRTGLSRWLDDCAFSFPGARYHVINRGNLRHDIFATAGARRSFVGVTGEACGKFGWRMHAYVVMRNHFHFALETPEPNLVAGMHWLQSTFAVRLLRFHGQHGHVFQESGRFRAELTSAPKSAPWKRASARTLRDAVAPPYCWLAEKLCMGKTGSVRAYVHAAGPGVVGRD